MQSTEKELTPFHKEYLWEFEIPRKQVLALAEAIPEDAYGWRPAEDARSFSAVLVHIAMSNLMLLYRADAFTPAVMEVCGGVEGEGIPQFLAMAKKGLALEKSTTRKDDVLDLLRRSFASVEESFIAISDVELGRPRDFGIEVSTYRRVYLRILAHNHEHMGQAIAYTRAMGFHVPWPNPVAVLEQMATQAAAPAS